MFCSSKGSSASAGGCLSGMDQNHREKINRMDNKVNELSLIKGKQLLIGLGPCDEHNRPTIV